MKSFGVSKLFSAPRVAVDHDEHELVKSNHQGNSHVVEGYCTAVVSLSPRLERFPDFFIVDDA